MKLKKNEFVGKPIISVDIPDNKIDSLIKQIDDVLNR